MNDSIFPIVRTIHYASTLIPPGLLLFLLLVARPIFALENSSRTSRAFAGSSVFAALELRFLWLAFYCVPLSLLSAFAWFWIVAARMAGDSLTNAFHLSLFQEVLTKTQFGEIWGVRFIIGFCLLFTLWISIRSAKNRTKNRDNENRLPRLWLIVNLLLAAALLALIAFAGHSAASHKLALTLASDMLHLLSVAAWPTGLLPLAIFLWLSKNEPTLQKLVPVLTRRFSWLSIVTVSLIVISGSVNSYFLVAHFSALWTTHYGRLLSLKLICFLIMLGIGFKNLTAVRQLLPTSLGSRETPELNSAHAFPTALYRRVILEICIAFLIVIIVSVLGLTPPATHPG